MLVGGWEELVDIEEVAMAAVLVDAVLDTLHAMLLAEEVDAAVFTALQLIPPPGADSAMIGS